MSSIPPPTTEKSPFPDFLALNLPQLIVTFLIAQRAPRLVKFSFLVLYAAYGIHILCFGKYDTGSQFMNLIVGNGVCQNLLFHFAFLWCIGDGDGHKHVLDVVRHEDDVNNKILPKDRGLFSRLYWSFCLVQATRSVGWSCQVKNILPARFNSRPRFLFVSIARFLEYFLIIDAGTTYLHLPKFVYGPEHTSIRALPFSELCFTVFVIGATGYAVINICYVAVSFVFVLIFATKPNQWPPLFGRWRDAYTLRRFWGYCLSLI
jgi:hypothetical protein